MVQPPTWALTAADTVRYLSLRPWQPRLAVKSSTEPLPARVERVRTAWKNSRLSDADYAADMNLGLLDIAQEETATKRKLNADVERALRTLGIELLLQNENVFDFPNIDLSRSMTAAEARYVVDTLTDIQTRIENDDRLNPIFARGLFQFFKALLEYLPDAAFKEIASAFHRSALRQTRPRRPCRPLSQRLPKRSNS